ncbi:MAG: HAD family hydrolase [Acidobacteriaceae bacterium]
MSEAVMEPMVTVETRGLLFDMDGVLISSIGSVERSWLRWAQHYGLDVSQGLQVPHGRRAMDIIRMLCPDIDADAGLRLIEDMEVEDMDDLKVLPGVAKLLRALPPEQWAVVTSATLRLAESRLTYAGLPLPKKFITAESVVNGKPHPEPYQRGAELLGLKPEECIVVEDAPAGVGAGKQAGCRVLAILTSHEADELRDADWIIPSLADLQYEQGPDGLLQLQFTPLA